MKPKSKSLKKPSHQDQDRSRSKKSKAGKRKRRYSSDSSDSSDTGRNKPHKSKQSKKNKKLHRISPSSTSSSSSYSSDYSASSCSTCEKQKAGRSTSPISRGNRKSKPRKGSISTSSKHKGRERGRSRSHKRSRSCSTCSSSSSTPSPKRSRSTSRSRSPARSKRFPKERGKAEKLQVSRRVESDSEERDKVLPTYDDIVSSSKGEEKDTQRQSEENEHIPEVSGKLVSEKTQNDGTKRPLVVDVELILRQKALENFIRFHKVKKCGISEERQGSVSSEPNKNVGSLQQAMDIVTETEGPVLEEPTKRITDMASKGKSETIPNISRPKIRSVIIIPEDRKISEDNTALDPYNTGEVSNCISGLPDHVEDEPSKWSELNPNPNPSASVVSGLEENEGRHETTSVRVETGGGQYEKKTFSRMHDGEMVQVSYKVYIPKKNPALARRKLQRGETSTSQI